MASETEYVEKVKKLVCFLGVKTHTVLSCLVETGDFQRFAKGNIYSAYLGLMPGENSSSDNINRLSITKAGNSHVRKLLVEASKGICKGAVGHMFYMGHDDRQYQHGVISDCQPPVKGK